MDDERFKLVIQNILHDKTNYPFLGHNRLVSVPVTEMETAPTDRSIPIESYEFLLEEKGSWEKIYRDL